MLHYFSTYRIKHVKDHIFSLVNKSFQHIIHDYFANKLNIKGSQAKILSGLFIESFCLYRIYGNVSAY